MNEIYKLILNEKPSLLEMSKFSQNFIKYLALNSKELIIRISSNQDQVHFSYYEYTSSESTNPKIKEKEKNENENFPPKKLLIQKINSFSTLDLKSTSRVFFDNQYFDRYSCLDIGIPLDIYQKVEVVKLERVFEQDFLDIDSFITNLDTFNIDLKRFWSHESKNVAYYIVPKAISQFESHKSIKFSSFLIVGNCAHLEAVNIISVILNSSIFVNVFVSFPKILVEFHKVLNEDLLDKISNTENSFKIPMETISNEKISALERLEKLKKSSSDEDYASERMFKFINKVSKLFPELYSLSGINSNEKPSKDPSSLASLKRRNIKKKEKAKQKRNQKIKDEARSRRKFQETIEASKSKNPPIKEEFKRKEKSNEIVKLEESQNLIESIRKERTNKEIKKENQKKEKSETKPEKSKFTPLIKSTRKREKEMNFKIKKAPKSNPKKIEKSKKNPPRFHYSKSNSTKIIEK